jgi:hypothetical protein
LAKNTDFEAPKEFYIPFGAFFVWILPANGIKSVKGNKTVERKRGMRVKNGYFWLRFNQSEWNTPFSFSINRLWEGPLETNVNISRSSHIQDT